MRNLYVFPFQRSSDFGNFCIRDNPHRLEPTAKGLLCATYHPLALKPARYASSALPLCPLPFGPVSACQLR